MLQFLRKLSASKHRFASQCVGRATFEPLEGRRLLAASFAQDSPTVFDVPGITTAVPSTNRVFVTPTGSDSVTRTQASNSDSPASFARALAVTNAGDTVILQAGEYRVGDFDVQKRLNFRAAPGAEVWLKGSDNISPSASRQWIQGTAGGQTAWYTPWNRKFNWDPTDTAALGGQGGDAAGDRDLTFLDGRSLTQVRSASAMGPGRFWIDTANQRLYIGDNPAGRTVEGGVRQNSMILRGADANGSSFRGIGVQHYVNQGLAVASANVTVADSAFVQNAVNGLSFSPGFGPTRSGVRPVDNVVQRNVIAANGKVGLNPNRADRLLVADNYFGYNNNEGFSGWAAGGMKFIFTRDARVYNNVVDRTYTSGSGIWFDVSSFRPWIAGNTVINTQGPGIHLELTDGGVVAFNTVADSAFGVWVHDASNTYVFNNTLSGNKQNLNVQDGPRINDWNNSEGSREGTGGKALLDYDAGATWVTRGTLARNNILSDQTVRTNVPTEWHIDVPAIDRQNYATRTYGPTTGNSSADDPVKIDKNITVTSPFTTNAEGMFATGFSPYLGWTVFDGGPSQPVRWHLGSGGTTSYSPTQFNNAWPNAMRSGTTNVFRQTTGGLFKDAPRGDLRLTNTNSQAFNFAAGLPADVRTAASAAGVFGVTGGTSGNGFTSGNFSGSLHPDAPLPRAANLIASNANFSGGTTGWTFTNATVENGQARAWGNIGDVRRTVTGLQAGATYVLKATARVESGVGSLFVTNYGGGSGGNPATLSADVRNTGSMLGHALTFRLPAGQTSATIGFSKAGNGAGFADDFVLLRVA